MPEADDRDEPTLLRRFREGDEEAFRRLFEQEEERLRARIRQRLPGPVHRRISVSDVLQETRIIAFERRDAFEDRGAGAFGNWVLGIADHRARKAVRHAGAQKRAVGREISRGRRPETGRLAGKGQSASHRAMATELQELARATLRTLPEDYQRVLELTRERGLTLDEAAEVLGRTVAATRKLRTRALARFADTFQRLQKGEDA